MTPEELDRGDPIAAFAARFHRPEGVIYLDGNSLGAMPLQTPARLAKVVSEEWGEGLIRSWNRAGWLEAPLRVGAKLAPLVGARADEVMVCDSTSVNLFKLLASGLRARPGRAVVVTEERNFPTDQYVVQGVAAMPAGCELRVVPREGLEIALDDDVAVLALTHVDYRSGEIHDMVGLTAAAHRAGALALWDLSHSTGAVAVDLTAAGADLAVGCGYKYLNGGPGAPAYVFVAQHLQDALPATIQGWMGHAEPFAFDPDYVPAAGIRRHLAGTPPILGLAALESALDIWAEVDREAVFAKGRALGDYFITLVEDRLHGFDFALASPREGARGSQVALRHEMGYPIMRALVERGVIGDFRSPDILRFGFAPLYTSFADIHAAVEVLIEVMESGAYRLPAYGARVAVT
ncbi:MAG: kynureninase [Candidatus Dormibacteria bacterium]